LATKQINFPDVIDKTEEEMNQIILLIQESTLSMDTKTFIIKCIELAMWLPNFVLNTKISMHRFAVMMFGKGYKTTNKPSDTKPSNLESSAQTESDQTSLRSESAQPANNEQAITEQPTNPLPSENSLCLSVG
jgi:transposase